MKVFWQTAFIYGVLIRTTTSLRIDFLHDTPGKDEHRPRHCSASDERFALEAPVIANLDKRRVGISQGGNTCFIAAAHQLLFHAPQTLSYLLDVENLRTDQASGVASEQEIRDSPLPALRWLTKLYTEEQDGKAISSDGSAQFRKRLACSRSASMQLAVSPRGDLVAFGDPQEVLGAYFSNYATVERRPPGSILRRTGRYYPMPEEGFGTVTRAKDINDFDIWKSKIAAAKSEEERNHQARNLYRRKACPDDPEAVCYTRVGTEIHVEEFPIFDLPSMFDERPKERIRMSDMIGNFADPAEPEGGVLIYTQEYSGGPYALRLAPKMVSTVSFSIPSTLSELFIALKRTVWSPQTGDIMKDSRPVQFDVKTTADGRTYIDSGISDEALKGGTFELTGCASNSPAHWWAYVKVAGRWYEFNDRTVYLLEGGDSAAAIRFIVNNPRGCKSSAMFLFKRLSADPSEEAVEDLPPLVVNKEPEAVEPQSAFDQLVDMGFESSAVKRCLKQRGGTMTGALDCLTGIADKGASKAVSTGSSSLRDKAYAELVVMGYNPEQIKLCLDGSLKDLNEAVLRATECLSASNEELQVAKRSMSPKARTPRSAHAPPSLFEELVEMGFKSKVVKYCLSQHPGDRSAAVDCCLGNPVVPSRTDRKTPRSNSSDPDDPSGSSSKGLSRYLKALFLGCVLCRH